MEKTRTVVLEVFEGKNFPPIDKVLLCWRVRGKKLETPLPFSDLRSKPSRGEADPNDVEVRLYVYRHSRSEEYVICGPVRRQEDDQSQGSEAKGSAPGVLTDVSQARHWDGCSTANQEGDRLLPQHDGNPNNGDHSG